jgi:tRNA U34 5-methylaminomethyl-2-thiouridine-forming methyltransferase MnmC
MQGEEQGGHGLDWREGGIPVSRRFDDPFFSLEGGLAETAHVFHAGNDLAARLADGFHIAETGFGTGLNLMATLALWQGLGRPGTIRFTSFEAFPLSPAEMAAAHAGFPALSALSAPFLDLWTQGARRFDLGGMAVEVIEGDARATLPAWTGRADAWFLDGFAPAKNPELWSEPLMAEVARHTAPGGTFATYTAAGPVRRALEAAGFAVARVPGFGRKRHMTRGILR